MDIISRIKIKFPKVSKVFFENESNMLFLRVEVLFTKLDDVTNISKKISTFIDQEDQSEKEYFLDIYSKGAEYLINFEELSKHLNQRINVKLKKEIKQKLNFVGSLLEVNKVSLSIKWNAKGQFRKQILEFKDILEIKKSI